MAEESFEPGVPGIYRGLSDVSQDTPDDDDDDDDGGFGTEQRSQNERRLQKLLQHLHREQSENNGNTQEIEMVAIGDDLSGDTGTDDVTADLVHVEVAVDDKSDSETSRRSCERTSLTSEPQDEDRMEQGEQSTRSDNGDSKIGVLLQLLKFTKWSEYSTTKKVLIVMTVVLILGLLLFVSLFPASFVYVEYHEYGLIRNKITNKIDYSRVYDSGCYLLAPQDEVIRFKATAHFVEQKLAVMNRDGLSIELDIMLQYFLKPSELDELFRKYHFNYEAVIESLIESTVKNTVVHFSLDEFRLKRKHVEAAILEELTYVLSGDCCDRCCPYNCPSGVNCRLPNCRLHGRCYHGHHVEVRYFQLGGLWIPDEVMNRLMKQVILQVETERELFHQQRALEVKKTELIVQRINNAAEEVLQDAKAKSKVILTRASAQKDRDVQLSFVKALKKLSNQLNITSEETKLSFMYVHSLGQMSGNIFTYNHEYNTIVAL